MWVGVTILAVTGLEERACSAADQIIGLHYSGHYCVCSAIDFSIVFSVFVDSTQLVPVSSCLPLSLITLSSRSWCCIQSQCLFGPVAGTWFSIMSSYNAEVGTNMSARTRYTAKSYSSWCLWIPSLNSTLRLTPAQSGSGRPNVRDKLAGGMQHLLTLLARCPSSYSSGMQSCCDGFVFFFQTPIVKFQYYFFNAHLRNRCHMETRGHLPVRATLHATVCVSRQ